jgi:hypothetical protein
LVQFVRELQPIIAALYISCPGRILLREQQVLSKNIVLSKTVIYATSCRNNGKLYAPCPPAGGQAGFSKTYSHPPIQIPAKADN